MTTPQRTCQIDGNIAVGKLIDQNGHTWHICAECIAFLWKWRQQENQIQLYQARTEESVDAVLALLREKLLGDDNNG